MHAANHSISCVLPKHALIIAFVFLSPSLSLFLGASVHSCPFSTSGRVQKRCDVNLGFGRPEEFSVTKYTRIMLPRLDKLQNLWVLPSQLSLAKLVHEPIPPNLDGFPIRGSSPQVTGAFPVMNSWMVFLGTTLGLLLSQGGRVGGRSASDRFSAAHFRRSFDKWHLGRSKALDEIVGPVGNRYVFSKNRRILTCLNRVNSCKSSWIKLIHVSPIYWQHLLNLILLMYIYANVCWCIRFKHIIYNLNTHISMQTFANLEIDILLAKSVHNKSVGFTTCGNMDSYVLSIPIASQWQWWIRATSLGALEG